MKSRRVSIMITLLLTVLLVSTVYADSDSKGWFFSRSSTAGVAPVTNDVYKEECGACHFPFQPGLLPARSWEKLLSVKSLENHFGENAELDDATRIKILNYAKENAADKSSFKRSKKMNASIKPGDTPLKITDVSYFKDKHHEIPKRLIIDNAKVKSLSNCSACHQKASEGVYEEDTVSIPGHGRWED